MSWKFMSGEKSQAHTDKAHLEANKYSITDAAANTTGIHISWLASFMDI